MWHHPPDVPLAIHRFRPSGVAVDVTYSQIVVLALIQGLTEFLPVSSSAHLILGSVMFGWPDQGLVFDVATHFGTLLAVVVYFRRELADLIRAWLKPAPGPEASRLRSLGLYLAAASVPALAAGGLAASLVEAHLRNVSVIAWATIGFGLLLGVAEWLGRRSRNLSAMNWSAAVTIGLAQVLAFVPGASRAGVTITAGRLLGFDSDSAARFSFLLSIPVIAGSGLYGMYRVGWGTAPIGWVTFTVVVALSAIAGWVCIAAFLTLLRRIGLAPFVVYRLILGLLLLWLIS